MTTELKVYPNAIVYLIEAGGRGYIGSTTQSLHRRMAGHFSDLKRNWPCASKLIIIDPSYTYRILEKLTNVSIQQLHIREGFHMRASAVGFLVNRIMPGRTGKERDALYCISNKEKIKQKNHDYRLNHLEELKIKRAVRTASKLPIK